MERDNRLYAQKVDELREALQALENDRSSGDSRLHALTSELTAVKAQRDEAIRRFQEEHLAREALESERMELRTQNERLSDVFRRETERRTPQQQQRVPSDDCTYLECSMSLDPSSWSQSCLSVCDSSFQFA